MKLSLFRLAAATSLLAAMVLAAHASSRPRYGGTVRILLHERVNTLDPLAEEDHPAARDKLAALLFETLTVVDAQGGAHPGLAASWRSDPGKRVWQFSLRLATFHDGSVVTAPDAVQSLARANGSWKITALDRQTLSIELPAPVLHMPEMLALPRFAVIRRNADNTLVGTGPYKLTEWQPGERIVLSANEDYWGGRPYPDSIEVQMGASLREQLLQRQLGQYAAADLTLDQVRTLEQASQNIAVSRPSDLLALVFLQPDSAPAGKQGRKPVDPRVREALASAVNRAAINNVILQKRGLPASGILPQWLTGYEFLFPGAMDLDHARELRADAAGLVIIRPIALAYDFSDPVAKLVAERIAVDAREAGITVQPYGETHVAGKAARAGLNADAVLLRVPLQSLEPSVALAAAVEDMGFPEYAPAALSSPRLEDLFEIEGKAMQNFRIIPIAHVSQVLWLNGNVHNWVQDPAGGWGLDQLWIGGNR